jgi:hypothetical protein
MWTRVFQYWIAQLEMPLELLFFHLSVGAGPTEKNVKANSAPIKTMILLIVGVSR